MGSQRVRHASDWITTNLASAPTIPYLDLSSISLSSCVHSIHCPDWSQSDPQKLKSDNATTLVNVSLFPLYWSLSLLNFLWHLIIQPFCVATASSLNTCYLQLVFYIRQQAILECSVFFCFQGFVEIVMSSSKAIPPSSASCVITSLVKPSLTSQSWISYSSPVLELLVVLITLYYKLPVCFCLLKWDNEQLEDRDCLQPSTMPAMLLGVQWDLLTKW